MPDLDNREEREFTDNGFRIFLRMQDTNGLELRLQESGVANQCVWLFTDRADDMHLDVAMATRLRDALTAFIEEAWHHEMF